MVDKVTQTKYAHETDEDAIANAVATYRAALMVGTGLVGLWAPATEGIQARTHCILERDIAGLCLRKLVQDQ